MVFELMHHSISVCSPLYNKSRAILHKMIQKAILNRHHCYQHERNRRRHRHRRYHSHQKIQEWIQQQTEITSRRFYHLGFVVFREYFIRISESSIFQ